MNKNILKNLTPKPGIYKMLDQNNIENGTTTTDIVDEEITYNYSFFHSIFALASMYMAMLYSFLVLRYVHVVDMKYCTQISSFPRANMSLK